MIVYPCPLLLDLRLSRTSDITTADHHNHRLTCCFHLSCWLPILCRAADLPSDLVVMTVMLSLLETVEMSSLSGLISRSCNII